MSEKVTYYLHTLDGEPAYFVPGQGLCFAPYFGQSAVLCRSLKQIREQQKADMAINGAGVYPRGYRRVRLP